MREFRFSLVGIDDDEWSWSLEGLDGEKWVIIGNGCEYSRREAVENIRSAMTKHGATEKNTHWVPF